MILRQNNNWLYFTLIVVAVLLLPSVLASFELCDSGFYVTFYDNIFRAPESVEYNFMYYLSGVVGGVVNSLVATGNFLILRTTGLLFLLASVIITWRYTSGLCSPGVRCMAIICIMAAYASSPVLFNYDSLSIFLLTLAVGLLVKGIECLSGPKIFMAGVITGIMVFARIPNILQFALIILIPVYTHAAGGKKWRFSLLYAGGYFTGISAIILLMIILGHWKVFVKNIFTLFSLSADSESSHSLWNLIAVQAYYYIGLLKTAIKFFILFIYIALSVRAITNKWLCGLLLVPAAVACIYLILTVSAVEVIGATVLPALILICIKYKLKNESLVAGGALLSSLIFPLGSDGVTNAGSIIYLLGSAPALWYWLNFRITLKGRILKIPGISIWMTALFLSFKCLVSTLCGGFYFDGTPLSEMKAMSSSPKLKGVLMSPQRAKIVDETVNLLDKYVSPGDTLFVFGSAPMFNYLTDTRPYLGNSWPELFSSSRLGDLLEEEEKKGIYPVICVQRFRTIGETWGTPSDEFMKGEGSDSNVFHNSDKWIVISDFLRRNNYQKADSTANFVIYRR